MYVGSKKGIREVSEGGVDTVGVTVDVVVPRVDSIVGDGVGVIDSVVGCGCVVLICIVVECVTEE